MKTLKIISVAFVLSFTTQAHSGVIIDWEGTGVDFYSSWLDADTLRIEIDAGSPGGGWADAVKIDSIAINGPGAWTWVNATDITLAGPGSFSGPVDGTGLNDNGCQGLSLGSNHQCWSGLADLTDNMFFDFTFSGDAVISSYTDNPHLKVRFINDDFEKVGSLLSTDLETVTVSEPGTIALLSLGLFGLLAARRVS